MPFDGRSHGIGALIPPYQHHPGAPALGQGLATALRHTYAGARAPRLLGQQAHDPGFRGSGSGRIVSDAYSGAARFWQVGRPAWVTGVLVETRVHVPPVEGGTILTRVRVTDGVDTDEAEITESLGAIEGAEDRMIRVLAPVHVPLSTVGSGPLDVVVDMYVYSPTATLSWVARVILVSAWWVTHG